MIAPKPLAHSGDPTPSRQPRCGKPDQPEGEMSDNESQSGREIAQQFPALPPRVADLLLAILLPADQGSRIRAASNVNARAESVHDDTHANATPSEPLAS